MSEPVCETCGGPRPEKGYNGVLVCGWCFLGIPLDERVEPEEVEQAQP